MDANFESKWCWLAAEPRASLSDGVLLSRKGEIRLAIRRFVCNYCERQVRELALLSSALSFLFS